MSDDLITNLVILNAKMVKRIEEMEKVIIDLHDSVSLHSIILRAMIDSRISEIEKSELNKIIKKMDEGVH